MLVPVGFSRKELTRRMLSVFSFRSSVLGEGKKVAKGGRKSLVTVVFGDFLVKKSWT